MFNEPLDHNYQIKDLEKYSFICENNTPEELENCFEDFYKLNYYKKKINDNEIRQYMNSSNYSYFAQGVFSSKFIESYNSNLK